MALLLPLAAVFDRLFAACGLHLRASYRLSSRNIGRTIKTFPFFCLDTVLADGCLILFSRLLWGIYYFIYLVIKSGYVLNFSWHWRFFFPLLCSSDVTEGDVILPITWVTMHTTQTLIHNNCTTWPIASSRCFLHKGRQQLWLAAASPDQASRRNVSLSSWLDATWSLPLSSGRPVSLWAPQPQSSYWSLSFSSIPPSIPYCVCKTGFILFLRADWGSVYTKRHKGFLQTC